MIRDSLKTAELLVIKVGSKVLLEADGRLNYAHIAHLVEQISHLKKNHKKIVFVSSGAVGAGMEALSLKKRPKDLPTLQAAAAIGQVRLMRAYEELFASFDVMVGQVLLTHDDLNNRTRHLNIKHTLHALLEKGAIPIINENDTVSVDEIKFGDNDVLASLVAMLLEAKALILLTTAQGFMIKKENGEEERLPHIVELNEDVLKHIETHKEGLSMGGMESKLKAAANMIHVGGIAVIAPGLLPKVLEQLFLGENIGTLVGKPDIGPEQKMPGRKRWIAFYHRPKGALVVDEGAKAALLSKGKSLLSVGILSVSGMFSKGSVIEIIDPNGCCFAKGITKLSHQEIKTLLMLQEKPRESEGVYPNPEVIHRDDMALLREDA